MNNLTDLLTKKVLLTLMFIIGMANVSFAQRSMTVETVDYMESSARELPFTHNILTTPFVADLELVHQDVETNETDPDTGKKKKIPVRIEYVEKEAFKNYIVTTGLISNIPTFKAIALANAAKEHEADIILGALVTVRTVLDEEGLGKLEITVSGYPARYCNFRTADQDELDRIKTAAYSNSQSNRSDVVTEAPEHKSSFIKENTVILK